MKNTDVLVFIGPSITEEEAKAILPNAGYLPPVQCGDIVRVLRLKPKVIAIIDGFFENTPAVWHKEILLAMEQGVRVYGASSMGALRAAELADLGMIGVGKVFQDYYHNAITDDDEVAVLHRPEQSNYLPVSDAMVNIRATIAAASEANIIQQKTADLLIALAKELFYPKRLFITVINLALEQGASHEEIERFKLWLEKNHYINQKKLDAVELLQLLKELDLSQLKPIKNPVKTHKTLFLRTVAQKVMSRPFSCDRSWLPLAEKVACDSRYLSAEYLLNRQLAQLLSCCDAIADKLNIAGKNVNDHSFHNSLLDLKFFDAKWQADHDMTKDEAHAMQIRFGRLDQLFGKYLTHENTVDEYFRKVLILNNEYTALKNILKNKPITIFNSIEYFQRKRSSKLKALYLIAYCWWVIDSYADELGLVPSHDSIQEYADRFRKQHNLLSQEKTENWFETNDLTLEDFHNLMLTASRIDYLVERNNLDSLAIEVDHSVWWLVDALRFTGSYLQAKKLVKDEAYKTVVVKEFANRNKHQLQATAFNLDFNFFEAEQLSLQLAK